METKENLFPANFDHKVCKDMYKEWEDKKVFIPDESKIYDSSFVVPIPPPNVTGLLHLGHAMTMTLEDIMIRHASMNNKRALRVPGTDHAGISTQVVVEKKVLKEEGKTRHQFERSEFMNKIWDFAQASRSTIIEQIKMMWASCDWTREQFTLSEKLSRAVRKSFVNLANANKISQKNYIINRCPRCQTVLSDIEVLHNDTTWKLYHIKYFNKDKSDAIVVATSRPDTMFGDVAIAVHPEWIRKEWIWKTVCIPITGKEIPVILEESVALDFWTWALKVTPVHDPVDFALGQKHWLPLDIFSFDKSGQWTAVAWKYANKDIHKDNEAFMQELQDEWYLLKAEDYGTSVPHCERCQTRIEPLVSKQRFVDVQEYADQSINAVKTWVTTIHPARFNKTYFDRLENIRPRCISRQLRRGHRIPVRYCDKGHSHAMDEDVFFDWVAKTDWYILWHIVFNLIADDRIGYIFDTTKLLEVLKRPSLTPQDGNIFAIYSAIYKTKFAWDADLQTQITLLESIVKEDNESALEQLIQSLPNIEKNDKQYNLVFACKTCGSIKLTQDPDVLDTRFSSALRPFAIMGRPENTADMEKYYPNTVLETGYDIIFFRVTRMMLMWFANTQQAPFKHVYLHGLVRDEKWRKMSKSLGNWVNPVEVIESHGPDALRLSLILGATPGNDVKFSMTKVDYASRFLHKLRNASKYVHLKIWVTWDTLGQERAYIVDNFDKATDADKWILNVLDNHISQVDKYFADFMYGEWASTIIDFVWNYFCDRYIEITKTLQSDVTPHILRYIIGTICKLLHPYTPFVTQTLWKLFEFEWYLIKDTRPKTLNQASARDTFNLFIEVIGAIRSLKQEKELKPNEKINIFIKWITDAKSREEYEPLIVKLNNALSVTFVQDGESFGENVHMQVVWLITIGIQTHQEINRDEVRIRLDKEIEAINNHNKSLEAMLQSEDFLKRAPEKIIEERKKSLQDNKEKIEKLNQEKENIASNV